MMTTLLLITLVLGGLHFAGIIPHVVLLWTLVIVFCAHMLTSKY